jgi:archaellum component FlaC
MSTVTENDLQELKDLIKEIKNDLEKNQIKLEGKLEAIDKRLENLEIINRTAVIGILLSLFGIIATAVSKYLFFP